MRVLIVFLLFFTTAVLPASAADRIMIFAASSMKDVIDRLIPTFTEHTGLDTVASFASSSVLARQIGAGAPADIFISADGIWMDWMVENDLVSADKVRAIAGNSLVIAVRKEVGTVVEPESLLTSGRFSMGDPSHVPAGRYAETALRSLNLWDKVRGNAVYAENVRVALELANRGETQVAIVYETDVRATADMKTAYVFPSESHDPVLYYAAPIKGSSDSAETFLDFMMGMNGWAVLDRLGFVPPEIAKGHNTDD